VLPLVSLSIGSRSRRNSMRGSRFLSLLPLGASVHQMPFYSRMYLNLLIGRVVHKTSDRLHEQQISPTGAGNLTLP